MNKTVTINISGIVFHIEEDAYDRLNKYLNTIRGYFSDADGREEIMADIQARIAEMLQERTSTVKQAVIMTDVEHIIAVMGKPEEFAGDKDTTQAEKEAEANQNYQDTSDYIPRSKRRRLFRDADDKWIGGVCSGIAHYFDCDPLWIRLAGIASIFMGGAGIFIYILLMIIIPKARTTAEKLEMRGERVDINSIKRSIQEDIDDLKKKAETFGNDVKDWGKKQQTGQFRSGIERFFYFLGDILKRAFQVFGKLLIVLLIIIGAILLSLFISVLFSFKGTHSITLHELDQLLFDEPYLSSLTVIGLVLAIAIPLVALIYKGITALIGIHKKNRTLNRVSLTLWITGVVMLIFVGIKTGSDFSARARSKTTLTLEATKNNTLYLTTLKDTARDEDSDDAYDYGYDDIDYDYDNNKHKLKWDSKRRFNMDNWGRIDNKTGKIILRYPTLDIQRSYNDSVRITITRIAHGENKKEAFDRTKNIYYSLLQRDSLIEFPTFFEIEKSDQFRAQQLRVTLFIPKGKIIHLGKDMRRIIYDIENVSNMYDGDMINHRWEMTENGLRCIDCIDTNSMDSDEGHASPPAPPAPPSHLNSKKRINIKSGDKEIIIEHRE